jgi:hypothetical protein
VLNDIDVCDRTGGTEQTINVRTEGDQRVGKGTALGRWPSAPGGFAVFVSVASGGLTETRTEIRGVMLSETSAPQPTCGNEEMTYTLAETGIGQPSLAMSRAGDTALVAYTAESEGFFEVRAFAVDADGCQVRWEGCPGFTTTSLVVSREPGVATSAPAVVATGDARFVIVWTAETNDPGITEGTLRARVVSIGGACPIFDGTVFEPTGAAATIALEGNDPLAVAAAPLEPERFVVVWYESVSGVLDVRTAVFDDRLSVVVPPRTVRAVPAGTRFAGVDSRADLAAVVRIAVVRSGEQVLLAWVDREDERSEPHVRGRFMNSLGEFLRAPADPEGDSFPLGSSSRTQWNPAVAALSSGGFAVAWEEASEPGGADEGMGIRGLLLDSQGAVEFANPVCDRTDFPLNALGAGNQREPAIATFGQDAVAAIWSDDGRNGDRSGSGVRGRVLLRSDLLPVQ